MSARAQKEDPGCVLGHSGAVWLELREQGRSARRPVDCTGQGQVMQGLQDPFRALGLNPKAVVLTQSRHQNPPRAC